MDSIRIQEGSQTETDGVPAFQDENKKPKTTHLAGRDRKNLSSSKAVRRTPTSKYRDGLGGGSSYQRARHCLV